MLVLGSRVQSLAYTKQIKSILLALNHWKHRVVAYNDYKRMLVAKITTSFLCSATKRLIMGFNGLHAHSRLAQKEAHLHKA
jgi:hypothetical protein